MKFNRKQLTYSTDIDLMKGLEYIFDEYILEDIKVRLYIILNKVFRYRNKNKINKTILEYYNNILCIPRNANYLKYIIPRYECIEDRKNG